MFDFLDKAWDSTVDLYNAGDALVHGNGNDALDAMLKHWEDGGKSGQALGPLISMVNPAWGAAFTAVGSLQAEGFGELREAREDGDKPVSSEPNTSTISSILTDQALQDSRDGARSGKSGPLVQGGDIFAQLAALIGEKLTENLESLIDKGRAIDASGDKSFEAASSFSGETEKAKVLSASLGEVIPAVGEALKNVSKT